MTAPLITDQRMNQEDGLYCQIRLPASADLDTLARLVDNVNKKAIRNKIPRIADIANEILNIDYCRAEWAEIKDKLHEHQCEFRKSEFEIEIATLLIICKGASQPMPFDDTTTSLALNNVERINTMTTKL